MPGAINEKDVSWFRRSKWANPVYNWLGYLMWGRGQKQITDVISGFRAITVDGWKRMGLDGSGHTIELASRMPRLSRPD